MNISDITVLHGLIRPCPVRDYAEPVEFTLTGRFCITISRYADADPMTELRLSTIIAEALASEGITVL